jgi:excinuclease ABC subunit B
VTFNVDRGITPKGVTKRIKDIIDGVYDAKAAHKELKAAQGEASYRAMSETELAKEIRRLERLMLEHARNLEFEQAGEVRDHLRALKEKLFGVAQGELPDAEREAAAAQPPAPRAAARR